MAKKIELSTKMETFEIEFKDRGITAEIQFNPADPDLAVRFEEMQKRIEEKLNSLTKIELDENGNAKDLAFVDNIKKVNSLLCDELDRAFGNKISDVVFQFCSPMAITGGEYFIVQFIKAISPVIEKSIKEKNKALNRHLQKYV